MKLLIKVILIAGLVCPFLCFAEETTHTSTYVFESYSSECTTIATPSQMEGIVIGAQMPDRFVKNPLPVLIDSQVVVFNSISSIPIVGESSTCQYRAYAEVAASFDGEPKEIAFFAITSQPGPTGSDGIDACLPGGYAYLHYETPLESKCLIILKAE